MVRGCSVAAAADEEPDNKPGSCMLLLLIGGRLMNLDLSVVPGNCGVGGWSLKWSLTGEVIWVPVACSLLQSIAGVPL